MQINIGVGHHRYSDFELDDRSSNGNCAGKLMSPLLSWVLIVSTILLSVGALWMAARLLIALLSLD